MKERNFLQALVVAVFLLATAAIFPLHAQPVDAPGLKYELVFTGLPDEGDLGDSIEGISGLKSLIDKRPSSLRRLMHRADADKTRIESLLRSKGYYAAAVSTKIEAELLPIRVTVSIRPGPLYRIGGVEIENAEGTPVPVTTDIPFKSLGIETGSPGDAGRIVGARQKLVRALGEKSYAYARVLKERVVVNHDRPAVFVYLTIDTGPAAIFGNTVVTGNIAVDEVFIRRRILWKKGDAFTSKDIEATRQKLSESGLFAGVTITRAEKAGKDGAVDMRIVVTERKKQSIGGGAGFSSGDGAGVTAFWTHRNLFGEGERLEINGEAATRKQVVAIDLSKPDLFSVRNRGAVAFRAAAETPDGYDSVEIELSADLERDFGDFFKGSVGTAVERSEIDDAGVTENFTLFSVPLSLQHDTSNDLLNPTDGSRTTLSVTPYLDLFGTDAAFTVLRLQNATYFPIDSAKRYSIAVWGRVTSLIGEETTDVPANKRIYGGGPGSVRAYALNRLGPLDSAADPIGGRSSAEAGIEARIRVYKDFAFVPFLEAGAVYDETTPQLGEDIQWGAGLGIRYHTVIGPVRFDFAVPFSQQAGDDDFQVLISLGQAF